MTHCTAVPPTRRGRLNRWLLALLALLPLMAAAAIVDGPNSYVYAIARGADGITYLGGNFTFWGPQTGGLGALGTADGAVNRNFPPVTAQVWNSPAASAVTPVSPTTSTARSALVVLPLPSCP